MVVGHGRRCADGLSATLLLALNGRIAGISGIVNGTVTLAGPETGRWLFLVCLAAGGSVYNYALVPQSTPTYLFAPLTMIAAGLLVGFGSRMGSGCTSDRGFGVGDS